MHRWLMAVLVAVAMLTVASAQIEDFTEDDVEPKKLISFEDVPDELTRRLVDYAEAPRAIVEELIILDVVPANGRFAFEENSVEMVGEEERQFVNLAADALDLNVVMGAILFFDPRTENPDILEFCGIAARSQPVPIEDGLDTTEYVAVAALADGRVVAFDNLIAEGQINDVEANLNTPIAVRLLFVAEGDTLALYIDGELRLRNLRITEERGAYGVLLRAGDTRTTCELRDVWAYTYIREGDDDFQAPTIVGSNAGLCLANGSVASKRSAPSTDAPIVNRFSGEDIEVVGETLGADNYRWYLLVDNTYVREDVVVTFGDCSNLPVVSGS